MNRELEDLSKRLHMQVCQKMQVDVASLEDIRFVTLAFCGEAGELANVVKKEWKKQYTLREYEEKMADELADCYVYLTLLARLCRVDLEKAALAKLKLVAQREYYTT
jgi:NTP pyrophosphatase (non-canonical NTP hydrolase)